MKAAVAILAAILLAGAAVYLGISGGPQSAAQALSGATLVVKDNKLTWAAVNDPAGIRAIGGLQRIPTGSGSFRENTVDFKFDSPGAKHYDIYLGGMFDVVGTAVHVDVTNMQGQTTHLFVRSTDHGYQSGSFEKK